MDAAPDASDTAAVEEAEAHDVRRLRWILRVSCNFVSLSLSVLSASMVFCLSFSLSLCLCCVCVCVCVLSLSLSLTHFPFIFGRVPKEPCA